jgi:protein-tyrosine-phosphatase/DNA-binding transcriptional ArsR family regulator
VTSPSTDVAAVEFLQLAGHPLRWQLLAELSRSDRTVQELSERVGGAQNLVSYHLGKLRAAGLVSTRRSSADRRDAYYAADLTRIGEHWRESAGALHPGLVPRVPTPDPTFPVGLSSPVRVLFLCTGNSARSQMAEAFATQRSDGLVHARSAGSHPKPLHPHAVRVMHEDHGLDISGNVSKHLSVFADERFDWVITVCDRVREVCPEFAGPPTAVHWSIPDPAAGQGDETASYAEFQRTAAELDTRVAFMLAVITADCAAPRTGRSTS